MKRSLVHYGGEEYVIGEDADEMKSRVDAIREHGAGWLEVSFGRGELRPAHLLVAPGVPLAIIDANDPGEISTGSGKNVAEPGQSVTGAAQAERVGDDPGLRPPNGVTW